MVCSNKIFVEHRWSLTIFIINGGISLAFPLETNIKNFLKSSLLLGEIKVSTSRTSFVKTPKGDNSDKDATKKHHKVL